MNTISSILSGIVQGLTEFFPVSSSGHLVLLHHLLGIKESIVFDIVLHLGTLIAVIIFFWKDCLGLIFKERKTFYLIVAASIPTFIIALLFKDFFENLFQNPRFLGFSFIFTGILIFISTRIYNKIKNLKENPNLINSILIGIAQGIAIIPGISRSGATISTGLILGIDKIKAFKFSFLLSIPAILGAVIFKFKDFGDLKNDLGIINILLGFFFSIIFGILALGILKKVILKNYFSAFSVYCLVLGTWALIFIR